MEPLRETRRGHIFVRDAVERQIGDNRAIFAHGDPCDVIKFAISFAAQLAAATGGAQGDEVAAGLLDMLIGVHMAGNPCVGATF